MENIHFTFGPVVQDEMSFQESLRTTQTGTKTDHNSLWFVALHPGQQLWSCQTGQLT